LSFVGFSVFFNRSLRSLIVCLGIFGVSTGQPDQEVVLRLDASEELPEDARMVPFRLSDDVRGSSG
jgi:hypothetical protein